MDPITVVCHPDLTGIARLELTAAGYWHLALQPDPGMARDHALAWFGSRPHTVPLPRYELLADWG